MKKLIILCLAVAALSTSAIAQTPDATALTFNPYLSVRMYAGEHHQNLAEGSTYADNEADLAYRLQGNTRFGAKMAAEGISGTVEFGLDANNLNTSNSADAYLRLAFATWSLGDFKVMAGQNYTPYTWVNPYGDVVDDNGMGGFGTTYDGRQPEITFSYTGLYLSFIKPSTTTTGIKGGKATYTASGTAANTETDTVNDTTVYMPKTAAGFDFKTEGFTAGLGGAVNWFKINDPKAGSDLSGYLDGKKIISWIGYFHTEASTGMFIVRANVAYGQNAGNFGIVTITTPKTGNVDSIANDTTPSAGYKSTNSTAKAACAVDNGSKIENTKHFEGYISPAVKIIPELMFACGVGYEQEKNKTYVKTDKQIMYFANAKVSLNKYYSITPEVSYRDFMKGADGLDQGTEWYAGAKFQMDVQ